MKDTPASSTKPLNMSSSKSREWTPAEKEIMNRIVDPNAWVDPTTLMRIIQENPSLRGFVYGYVAEQKFVEFLENVLNIRDHSKDDDHLKTKSDRTIIYRDRVFTVQLKSLQTLSIREINPDVFKATVQNDASDRRKISLPDGTVVETTCYVAGEYDILAVSIQPFVGAWQFAFKKNKDLRHSTSKKYSEKQKQYLLATTESIVYPLEENEGWTTNLFLLLEDIELGRTHISITASSASEESLITQVSTQQETIIIEENTQG